MKKFKFNRFLNILIGCKYSTANALNQHRVKLKILFKIILQDRAQMKRGQNVPKKQCDQKKIAKCL